MFEESTALYRRMADRARQAEPHMARRYADRAEEVQTRAELIRRILLGETSGAAGGDRRARAG
jgi:hypothetical protein